MKDAGTTDLCRKNRGVQYNFQQKNNIDCQVSKQLLTIVEKHKKIR